MGGGGWADLYPLRDFTGWEAKPGDLGPQRRAWRPSRGRSLHGGVPQPGRLRMGRKPARPGREPPENGLCVRHNKKAFLPPPRGRKRPAGALPQPERRLCWWPGGPPGLECVGRDGQGGSVVGRLSQGGEALGCREVGPCRFSSPGTAMSSLCDLGPVTSPLRAPRFSRAKCQSGGACASTEAAKCRALSPPSSAQLPSSGWPGAGGFTLPLRLEFAVPRAEATPPSCANAEGKEPEEKTLSGLAGGVDGTHLLPLSL